MKKLTGILFLFLIIPQLAWAAWWNPISWIKKPSIDQEKSELTERLLELEKKVNVESDKADRSNIKTEVKEKVVTQTIKVDNPELQAKVDALISENESLKLRVNDYISKLNQCREGLTKSLSEPIRVINTSDEERNQKLVSIDKQILSLLNTYISQKDGYGNLASNPDYKPLNIAVVNQLLQSYRVIDAKMTYGNLSDGNNYDNVVALRKYLQEVYIPYR